MLYIQFLNKSKRLVILLKLCLLLVISFIISSCEQQALIIIDYEVVAPKPQMVPFKRFEEWGYRQGGAIYDDYLVTLDACDYEGSPNGYIHDIQTGKKICDLDFGNVLGGKKYTKPHANQVSFGSTFLDSQSIFPLLYVSQVNGGKGDNDLKGELGVLVYNLKRISELEFFPEIVQVIIPDTNDSLLMKKIGKYTPNYIVDTDLNRIIIIGYPNPSWNNLKGEQPIAVINLPSLSVGQEVIFTDEDLIDYYTLPYSLGLQQSFYYNGRVFSSNGVFGSASVRIINLNDRKVESFFELSSLTPREPQFLGKWKDKILYYENNNNGQLYELILPGYVFKKDHLLNKDQL